MASAEPLRAEVEAAGLDFGAVGPPWHESDADALLPGFGAAGSAGQLAMFATPAPVLPPQQVLDYTTDPTAVTATQVSQATTRILETPTYRQAAQRIAAEIATAPPPSTIRPWLTSLAGNG